jgi:hypothetical protein
MSEQYETAVWILIERMQAEIAREVRVLLGEEQYEQRIFTDADTARRIEALQKCAAFHTSDAERHEAWRDMHFASGWLYGEMLDPANKRHPNLLPWDELPASTRVKARIFDICARYGAQVVELPRQSASLWLPGG